MSSKKKMKTEAGKASEDSDPSSAAFPKTKKDMENIFKMFKCAHCSQVPEDKLFMLGGCAHKYCEACLDNFSGKECHVCDRVSSSKEAVPDLFASSFLQGIRNMEKHLNEEIEQQASLNKSNNKQTDNRHVVISAKKGKTVFAIAPGVNQDLKVTLGTRSSKKSSENIFDFHDDDGEDKEKEAPTSSKQKKTTKRIMKKNEPKGKGAKAEEVSDTDDTKDTKTRKSEADDEEEKGMSRRTLKKKNNKEVVPEKAVSVLNEKNEQADDDFKTKDISTSNTSRSGRKRKGTTSTADEEGTPQQRKKIDNKKQDSKITFDAPNSEKSSTSSNLNPERKGSPEITDLCSIPVKTKGLKRKRNASSASGSSVASSRANVPKNSPANGATNMSPSFANTSFSSSCPVDKRNAKGETQLHVACRAGQLEKIKQLVEKGADINAQDHAGWTPLHESITGKGTNKLELVTYLCEQKCNTNIPGMDSEFALHEAARAGLDDIVDCLLGNSASPNVRNKKGQLPRDVAANDAIKSLLDNAAGIDGVGNDSLNGSMSDDPVVLQLQFAKALLFFAYDLPEKECVAIEGLKLRVSKALGGEVTHIIFDEQEKERGKGKDKSREVSFSREFLHGMAHGTWMLHREWIDKCIAEKKLLSPRDYEVQGCYDVKDAPTKARLNKEVGNPGLLHGFTFYLYKSCPYESFNKQQLSKLIIAAEGKVINREPHPDSVDPLESPIRFHAKEDNHKLVLTSHVILYGDKDVPSQGKKLNMEHIKTLHVKWLIESIGSFSLLNPDLYL